MKSSDEILKSLEKNIILPPQKPLPVVKYIPPENDKLQKDSEEDYAYSRDKLKKLIDTSETALEKMLIVAEEAEHPRAFEVLAGMIKTTSEVTMELMKLQSVRKELLAQDRGKSDSGNPASTTNLSVFIGTTLDLQKQIQVVRDSKNLISATPEVISTESV